MPRRMFPSVGRRSFDYEAGSLQPAAGRLQKTKKHRTKEQDLVAQLAGFMIRSFRELLVYQKAFEQAMRIFELTKSFQGPNSIL
jgi:hypothetical protein